MRGPLVRPESAGYAKAAQLYNPRFDGKVHPAAIARCVTADDVAAGVRFAADSRVPFAVRSGGHSYGGWSASPGLVIDIAGLDKVTVDTANGVARIGAGAKLAAVYAALAAKGVAIAGGSCPTVGIAGLALGGGLGVLNRAFGLTCDAIRAVEIVTADGSVRPADADLLWALKGGGGGSFGAVTSFTMAVRPAPTVSTFYFAWDIGHAPEVVNAWQRWVGRTDAKLWSTCKVLANRTTGRQRAVVSGTWIGPSSLSDGQLKPLLDALPSPASTSRNSFGYGAAMRFFAGSGAREAFAATSSVIYENLPLAALDAIAARVGSAMGIGGLVEAGISLDALGGAVADVPPDATAFAHRQALAIAQYTATFVSGAATKDTFVRDFRDTMRRWCGDWAYVNYADPSLADYGTAYWRQNYARLRATKRDVDPHDLFTFPQAVPSA
jgi:FAD/FMN-containing dehydrogenase